MRSRRCFSKVPVKALEYTFLFFTLKAMSYLLDRVRGHKTKRIFKREPENDGRT